MKKIRLFYPMLGILGMMLLSSCAQVSPNDGLAVRNAVLNDAPVSVPHTALGASLSGGSPMLSPLTDSRKSFWNTGGVAQ